jgi:rare lipoprotein A
MRSSTRFGGAALALLLFGCSGSANAPPAGLSSPTVGRVPNDDRDGLAPSGAITSAAANDDRARYDAVGHASWYGGELGGSPTASGMPFDPAAITAAHRTLPLGSYAEVTSLDTGRTILVLINDRGPGRLDREIDLSRGAAQALGTSDRAMAPIRVRAAGATPSDAAALAAGRAATARLDAPPAVLAALRARLGTYAPRPTPAPSLAARRPRPTAAIGADSLLVQVAAFSNATRAAELADRLHGRVEPTDGLYRVRLGPYADPASAERARDDVARRGYGDATIIVQP